MKSSEINLVKKRKYYLKRRNIIRRLFLIFIVGVNVFLFYKLFHYPEKKILKLESYGNKVINNSLFEQEIYSYTKGKNFHLISPRTLSQKTIKALPIIEDIVVRKYIFPDIKLIISFKEKELWAQVVSLNNKNIFYFASNKGDLIHPNTIDIKTVNPQLPIIVAEDISLLSDTFLLAVKNFVDSINKRKLLRILNVKISKNNELEINDFDGLKIKVGQIQNESQIKLQRLESVLNIIKERYYCIEYLDLNYEGSAVIKPCMDKKKNKKLKLKINPKL